MKLEARSIPMLPSDTGEPTIPAIVTPGRYALVEFPRSLENAKLLEKSKEIHSFEAHTEDTLATDDDPYLLVHNYPDPDQLASFIKTLDDDTKNNLIVGIKWQPVQFNNFDDLVQNAIFLKKSLHDAGHHGIPLSATELLTWVQGPSHAKTHEPAPGMQDADVQRRKAYFELVVPEFKGQPWDTTVSLVDLRDDVLRGVITATKTGTTETRANTKFLWHLDDKGGFKLDCITLPVTNDVRKEFVEATEFLSVVFKQHAKELQKVGGDDLLRLGHLRLPVKDEKAKLLVTGYAKALALTYLDQANPEML